MPAPALIPAISLAASKKAAIHAAASIDFSTVSSASLAYVLARLAWQRLPQWIKEDVSLRSLLSKPGGDAQELANLTSVIEKLQALVASGSDKLLSEPIPHVHAALFAYLQLEAQLHKKFPKERDEWYRKSGVPIEYIKELKEYMDYAVLAYESNTEQLESELEKIGDFSVLQHNSLMARPGHVGHFMAVSEKKKLVVIAVKGTSTLEDILTDCCGRAVSYKCDEDRDDSRIEVRAAQPNQIHTDEEGAVEVTSGHERIWVEEDDEHTIRCHEGILASAKRLADAVQSKVEDLVIKEGYELVLCGHSLGAGAASLVAVVLRARLPALADQSTKMRVFAFAPPPILDHDSAFAASSYTTSIVNNSDIIPRSSLANLAVFLEFLRAVTVRLKERGMAPTGPKSTTALIRKLSKGTDDDDFLMTLEEVQTAMDAAHDKVELRDPDHLYIPGRVLIMYESWADAVSDEKGNAGIDDASSRSHIIVTDGAAGVLRFFEFEGYRLLSDHLSVSYDARLCAFSTRISDPQSLDQEPEIEPSNPLKATMQ